MIIINGSYYKNPTFPTLDVESESNSSEIKEEVIRNIITFSELLTINIKKKVTIHSDNNISGILEYVGNDFIIVYDPSNGVYHTIKLYIVNYIEFEEKIKTF